MQNPLKRLLLFWQKLAFYFKHLSSFNLWAEYILCGHAITPCENFPKSSMKKIIFSQHGFTSIMHHVPVVLDFLTLACNVTKKILHFLKYLPPSPSLLFSSSILFCSSQVRFKSLAFFLAEEAKLSWDNSFLRCREAIRSTQWNNSTSSWWA